MAEITAAQQDRNNGQKLNGENFEANEILVKFKKEHQKPVRQRH